jgi:hypothetical protein
MKAPLLALLLAATSGGAVCREWVLVGEVAGAPIYVDIDSIDALPGGVLASWFKTDSSRVKAAKYEKSLSRIEVKCKPELKARVVSISVYRKDNGKPETAHFQDRPFTHPIPESLGEMVASVTCSGRQGYEEWKAAGSPEK